MVSRPLLLNKFGIKTVAFSDNFANLKMAKVVEFYFFLYISNHIYFS